MFNNNALTPPILLYGSEIWALIKKDKKKTDINQDEILFRRTAVCTLFDHKRNEEVLEELKVEPVDLLLRRHKIKLATTRNGNRMTNTGLFIMFSMITNIYNKKTKVPTLMEFFTATGKLKKDFFDN